MYKIKSLIILVGLFFLGSLVSAETNQSPPMQSLRTNASVPKIKKRKTDFSLLKNNQITPGDLAMLKTELSKAEDIVNQSTGGLNKKVRISGSSRFELRGIYLKQYQLTNDISPLVTGIDPGATGEPNLMMHFMAMPYYNVALTAELGLYTRFDATQQIQYEFANNFFMESSIATGLGKYKLAFGGNWWTLFNSKLTFSGNISGGRTFYFPRYPWAPPDAPISEYSYESSYFDWFMPVGTVQRAGSVGVKGVQITGQGLPANLAFSIFGGYNDKYYGTMSKLLFWKISKKLGAHNLALNGSSHFINSTFALHSSEQNSVFALEDGFKLLEIQVFSEISVLHEEIPSVKTNVLSYAGYLDIRKNIINKFPIKLFLYYTPESFYAPNTAVVETKQYYPTQSIVYYNILEEESSLYQNRTGVRCNVGVRLNGALFSVQYALSKTLTKTTNIINFPHHLLHSEFFYNYKNNPSAYDAGDLHASEADGGYTVDYEGAYETVYMSNASLSHKYFNTIKFDMKTKLGDIVDILQYTYVFGDAGIRNISTKVGSPLNPDAFRKYFYNVFLAQGITKNIFLLAFYGQEHFQGYNLTTNISEVDTSYGLGLSFAIFQNTVLYVKSRYFQHKDFIANRQNNFSGYWSNIELKTLF